METKRVKKPISIVIPSHNEASYLPVLLSSITNHLHDNFQCQTIVVDNGSNDETQKVLEDWIIDYIQLEEKTFPSIARNIGAKNAKNDVIVFLDADTEITVNWANQLAKVWPELSSSSMLVTGAKCSIPSPPSLIEKYWFANLGRGTTPSYINGCNIITNRITFSNNIGFNEKLETGEDVDFADRANRAGAKVIHDSGFKIFHHGYPKTLMAFIRREIWHATGDISSTKHFFASKVAIVSLVFSLLHLLAIVNTIYYVPLSLAFLLGIIGICVLSSVRMFRKTGVTQVLIGVFIYYFYYAGRTIGLTKGFLRNTKTPLS